EVRGQQGAAALCGPSTTNHTGRVLCSQVVKAPGEPIPPRVRFCPRLVGSDTPLGRAGMGRDYRRAATPLGRAVATDGQRPPSAEPGYRRAATPPRRSRDGTGLPVEVGEERTLHDRRQVAVLLHRLEAELLPRRRVEVDRLPDLGRSIGVGGLVRGLRAGGRRLLLLSAGLAAHGARGTTVV